MRRKKRQERQRRERYLQLLEDENKRLRLELATYMRSYDIISGLQGPGRFSVVQKWEDMYGVPGPQWSDADSDG